MYVIPLLVAFAALLCQAASDDVLATVDRDYARFSDAALQVSSLERVTQSLFTRVSLVENNGTLVRYTTYTETDLRSAVHDCTRTSTYQPIHVHTRKQPSKDHWRCDHYDSDLLCRPQHCGSGEVPVSPRSEVHLAQRDVRVQCVAGTACAFIGRSLSTRDWILTIAYDTSHTHTKRVNTESQEYDVGGLYVTTTTAYVHYASQTRGCISAFSLDNPALAEHDVFCRDDGTMRSLAATKRGLVFIYHDKIMACSGTHRCRPLHPDLKLKNTRHATVENFWDGQILIVDGGVVYVAGGGEGKVVVAQCPREAWAVPRLGRGDDAKHVLYTCDHRTWHSVSTGGQPRVAFEFKRPVHGHLLRNVWGGAVLATQKHLYFDGGVAEPHIHPGASWQHQWDGTRTAVDLRHSKTLMDTVYWFTRDYTFPRTLPAPTQHIHTSPLTKTVHLPRPRPDHNGTLAASEGKREALHEIAKAEAMEIPANATINAPTLGTIGKPVVYYHEHNLTMDIAIAWDELHNRKMTNMTSPLAHFIHSHTLPRHAAGHGRDDDDLHELRRWAVDMAVADHDHYTECDSVDQCGVCNGDGMTCPSVPCHVADPHQVGERAYLEIVSNAASRHTVFATLKEALVKCSDHSEIVVHNEEVRENNLRLTSLSKESNLLRIIAAPGRHVTIRGHGHSIYTLRRRIELENLVFNFTQPARSDEVSLRVQTHECVTLYQVVLTGQYAGITLKTGHLSGCANEFLQSVVLGSSVAPETRPLVTVDQGRGTFRMAQIKCLNTRGRTCFRVNGFEERASVQLLTADRCGDDRHPCFYFQGSHHRPEISVGGVTMHRSPVAVELDSCAHIATYNFAGDHADVGVRIKLPTQTKDHDNEYAGSDVNALLRMMYFNNRGLTRVQFANSDETVASECRDGCGFAADLKLYTDASHTQRHEGMLYREPAMHSDRHVYARLSLKNVPDHDKKRFKVKVLFVEWCTNVENMNGLIGWYDPAAPHTGGCNWLDHRYGRAQAPKHSRHHVLYTYRSHGVTNRTQNDWHGRERGGRYHVVDGLVQREGDGWVDFSLRLGQMMTRENRLGMLTVAYDVIDTEKHYPTQPATAYSVDRITPARMNPSQIVSHYTSVTCPPPMHYRGTGPRHANYHPYATGECTQYGVAKKEMIGTVAPMFIVMMSIAVVSFIGIIVACVYLQTEQDVLETEKIEDEIERVMEDSRRRAMTHVE